MQIGQKYKAHKDNVVDIFNIYKDKRGNENDGVDINFLEQRIKSLKDGKYTLAVAGEVKAGKSTFINALLGAEILPADVLQATSAVIEIFKSKNSYLKVKFANGEDEIVYDDIKTDEAKERLSEICSVKDEYREIPTTILNEIIIKSAGNVEVTENLIDELNQKARINLNYQNSKNTIQKYIEENSLKNIPINIEFGYPFKWNFDEFRIVDTPGVNAVGGIQDISFKYLENANAILFAKSINSIESESFKEFVNSKISKRSKDTLFLVLTHAGLHFGEVERLHNEAIRLYENIIPKERILAVDSILSLIYTDLKNGLSLEQIEEIEENKKSKPKSQIIPFFERKANKKNINIKDYFGDCSGFKEMYESIDDFSTKAPMLQLEEIIIIIKNGYNTLYEQYKGNINLLNIKQRNPQEFEQEILRILKALSEYQNLLLVTNNEIEQKYEGRDSIIYNEIERLKLIYPEKITHSKNIEDARKNLTNANNEIDKFLKNFSADIKAEFSNKFEEIGREFKAKYKITLPKVDFSSIENEAKKNAYKNKDIFDEREADFWDFLTFGITRIFRDNRIFNRTERVYDALKHLDAYRNGCNRKFYAITNNLVEISKQFIKQFLVNFDNEINKVIDVRKEELENERTKKQTNQEIIDEIENIKSKKKEIEPQITRITELKENLL